MATNRGLLPNLSNLRVSPSQAMGKITLENLGDAEAYPVWNVRGPGNKFEAISPIGETLRWNGTLPAGVTLTVDTQSGTVIDSLGVNRYSELDAAPVMWAIQPGMHEATASLDNTTTASRIAVSWRARRWMVM